MKATLHVSRSRRTVPDTTGGTLPGAQYDVVVVGAGPYGLATAAHLRASGLKVAVFGVPLQLWREHMPEGMLLRSYWWASSISDPSRQAGLGQYLGESGLDTLDPLPAHTFVQYGLWFQKRLLPDVDPTYVETIERADGQFVVTLADTRVIRCQNVVMAPGLRYYAYRPDLYDDLPPALASHTADNYSLQQFAGKQLLIIGGGQSALETAALAVEGGAHVHLVTRRPLVWIQDGPSLPTQRSQVERILHPKAGISPGWFSWCLEHFPYAFQRLPQALKTKLLRGIGSYGPMGAAWLKPRVLGRVTLHESQQVLKVEQAADGVRVQLSDAAQMLKADHIILATGYRVNVKNLPMLAASLLDSLHIRQGAPILDGRFESSIAGLYFVGFTSVASCGPLYRFVVGTDACARRVSSSIVRRIAHA